MKPRYSLCELIRPSSEELRWCSQTIEQWCRFESQPRLCTPFKHGFQDIASPPSPSDKDSAPSAPPTVPRSDKSGNLNLFPLDVKKFADVAYSVQSMT